MDRNKISDLSPQEVEEFNQLRKKLFNDDKFKVFSEEEDNSPEMKRYNLLIEKKMAYYRSINMEE